MHGRYVLAALVVATVLVGEATVARAGVMQMNEGFESSPPAGWEVHAGAGFDVGDGAARTGEGAAWIGQKPGTNAISTWLDIPKYSLCHVAVWVKLSPGFAKGSLYVSSTDGITRQGIIKEVDLPQGAALYPEPGNFNLYSFDFNTGPNPRVSFTASETADDERSWARLDDLSVNCKTPT